MRGNSLGFSLIELIMVVILLGVMSVVVLPRLSSVTEYEAMGFFDELIGATRYGQKLAIATNCKVRVAITTSGYGLTLPDSVSNCHAAAPAFTTDVPHHTRTGPFQGSAPAGVVVATPATVTFNASGAADADYTVQVGSHAFKVHASTGYVEQL